LFQSVHSNGPLYTIFEVLP